MTKSSHNQRVLATIPWVKKLKDRTQRCEGYRWSRMPLKAIYPHGKKRSVPPTGKEPYRCKLNASWKFTALRKSFANDGVYCTHHLYTQLQGDMLEAERLNKWYRRAQWSQESP